VHGERASWHLGPLVECRSYPDGSPVVPHVVEHDAMEPCNCSWLPEVPARELPLVERGWVPLATAMRVPETACVGGGGARSPGAMATRLGVASNRREDLRDSLSWGRGQG